MANIFEKLVEATIPNELIKFVTKAVPKEVKKAVPKEVAGVADPLGIGGLNKNPGLLTTFDPLKVYQTAKGTSVPAPGYVMSGKAPAYDETLLKTFNAQLKLQDPLLAGTRQFGPQWLEIQRDSDEYLAQARMDLMEKLYPQSGRIEAAYQNQIRQNELQNLQSTLPQYQKAFSSLTPGYSQAIAAAGQLAAGSLARANVAPQLTAFENEVSSPYGPRPQQQAAYQQQAGIAPASYQQQEIPIAAAAAPVASAAPTSMAAYQGQEITAPAGAAAAAFPAPSSNLINNMGSMSIDPSLRINVANMPQQYPAANSFLPKSNIPLAPALPESVQGPQAPTKEYLDQQVLKKQAAAAQEGASQILADKQKMLNTVPQLTQQQAWGIQNQPPGPGPAGQPPQGPPLNQQGQQMSLRDAVAGQYAAGVTGPRLDSGLQNINQDTVNQYVQTMPGMEGYAQKLAEISQQELAAGRGLTPEEERMSQQAARAGYAARGTALGGQSVAAEVLNRADVANQRFQQRMGTAREAAAGIQGVYQPALDQSYQRQMSGLQYGLNAQGQNYQQAMGREALLSSTQQSAFSQALQRGNAEQQRLQAGTAIQAGQAQIGAGALGQLQAAQQPILQAYYKQPILQQTVAQAQTMGLASQAASGNSLFQPESPMGFQSAFLPYNSNIAMQQSQMQANAAQSAGKSSMTGSLIGAGGTAVGMAFAACWVAREVYGQENPLWKVFRSWLFNEAPEWFKNAYIKHGPKIADFIKDKPVLKSIIRKWMDSKIESYLTA